MFFFFFSGFPTAVSGILCFGIPRVAVAGCVARSKAKSDDDEETDDHESRHHDGERTPLVRPVVINERASAPVAAVPPAGFYNAVPPSYGSVGSMPHFAPSPSPYMAPPPGPSLPNAVEYK